MAERLEIVQRRDRYERDPDGFAAEWAAADGEVRERLRAAIARLPLVELPRWLLERASLLCVRLGTDGLRGELTLFRAMRALAAFEGIAEPDDTLLARTAPMALRHRLRRDPLDEATAESRVRRALEELPAPAAMP